MPSELSLKERSPHEVITFYSYKGGTGRSMALANTAWILASNGWRVLAIDWDLEAPGLHRYFQPFLVDADIVDTDGLIDYMWSLTSAIMSSPSSKDGDGQPRPDLLDYRVCVDWPFPLNGSLDFVPAGRQGANYPQRVNSFDWENFYTRLDGARVLRGMRDNIRRQYDYVLIDSRTGVTDTSGICTVQMPNTLVGLFTLNNQSIEGVAAILDSALALREKLDEGPLRVYPVVSRVEDGEQPKLEASRARCRDVFARFVEGTAGKDGARSYWDDMEIPYKKFFAYEEVLATFGDVAGTGGSKSSLLSSFERLTRRVTGLKDIAMPAVDQDIRKEILSKYAAPDSPSVDPTLDAPHADQSRITVFLAIVALLWMALSLWSFLKLPYGMPGRVAALGAVGGSVSLMISLVNYIGARRLFRLSWVPSLLLRPLTGIFFALVFYLAVIGGFAADSTTSSPQAINPYGMYALALLAGFFADQAMDKLRETIAALVSRGRPVG